MGLTRDVVAYVAKVAAGLQQRLNMVARRGQLTTVDASGTSTRVGVKISVLEAHEGVELLEPYGFTSHPPVGSKVILLCPGGDGGHPIALLAGDPSTRLSGLDSGDLAIHVGAGAGGGTGARIVLRASGDIEVEPGPAGQVRIVPNGAVEPPLAVARQTDPIALNATDVATINAIVGVWNATMPGGGPLLATPGIVLPTITGTGTITAGGTGTVST